MGFSEAFWRAFKRKDYEVLRTEELEVALHREYQEEDRNFFYVSAHKEILENLILSRREMPSRLDKLTRGAEQ